MAFPRLPDRGGTSVNLVKPGKAAFLEQETPCNVFTTVGYECVEQHLCRKEADCEVPVGSFDERNELVGGRCTTLGFEQTDQCHNVEDKISGQNRSMLNVQEMTARALLVDTSAMDAAQRAGDVLGATVS